MTMLQLTRPGSAGSPAILALQHALTPQALRDLERAISGEIEYASWISDPGAIEYASWAAPRAACTPADSMADLPSLPRKART